MTATLVHVAGVLHSIVGPNGQQWRIGERVGIWGEAFKPYREAVIAGYEPGSWEPHTSNDATAWFMFEDGSMVRPHLLVKPMSSHET